MSDEVPFWLREGAPLPRETTIGDVIDAGAEMLAARWDGPIVDADLVNVEVTTDPETGETVTRVLTHDEFVGEAHRIEEIDAGDP